ncbi:ROK family protein [Tunturiibacter gelidoferens]|uniref:NBD/HSP70 family sugar kinase n=1 Tax=Tunturiibacter gelidiferens TaxID=3069689 RepID=A0ACC5P119_9BACT|nr:ROK family protein [Edaphobacter lichenicola]MBB5340415.1 putative NBD/HSP70 family sugar kinase [Edaphobacter lichenicola]
MAKTIGVILSERISAGLVVDHKLVGPVRRFPEDHDDEDALVEQHTEALVETIASQVLLAADGAKDITAVGVALPGLVKDGVVAEAPNLPQLKGAKIQELLIGQLRSHGLDVTVTAVNDADGMAAGLASMHGKLDSMIRVWTLGVGIGYGRYPFAPGAWEGGHTVVTLDEKERFCGCGGRGHMEGIMGHRAMRLRFLDMEPEEVFEAAKQGDARCVEFKRLWHKALAAASATTIHMAGPGKIFIAGFNTRFLDMSMLKDYLQQMVKMSPLQGYSLEIVDDTPEVRVIGAAVSAEQAATR